VKAAQREATIVAMGLVIVASIVVVYLLNESNRREAAAERHTEISIDRGAHTYVEFCLSCHGAEGLAGEGRQGVPLNTPANMSTDLVLGAEREAIIREVIERGRGEIMPAWAIDQGGPFNDEQINDLVTMIRNGAWDLTAELDRELHGGVPATPPALPTPDPDSDPGEALFGTYCATCHMSNDYPQGGVVGPDLTGLGAMDQTPQVGVAVEAQALSDWLHDPQSIQPGTIMPSATSLGLSDDQIDQLVEYLLNLE
jgi:mono/diheme cytochrome c family protein